MAERRIRTTDSPRRRKRESPKTNNQDELPRTRAPYNPTELSSSYSSSSSSYIDISRTFPARMPRGLAAIAAFFTAPPEHRHRPRRKRSTRFLRQVNSSSSSINSDLAYGTGFVRRRKSEKSRGKRREIDNGDRRNNRDARPGKSSDAAILAVGAGLAELARKQNRLDMMEARKSGSYSGKREDSWTVNGLESSRGLGSSKISHGPDEDGWESASEADSETSSVDTTLAYGHATGKTWSFGFGRAKRKDSVVDPRLFGPQNSLLGVIQEPVGFHDDMVDHDDLSDFMPPTVEQLQQEKVRKAESTVSATGSLQHVYPVPTSDPNRFDVERQSNRGRDYVISEQPQYTSRPAPLPIQQPQPIIPVSQSVYDPPYTTRSEPKLPSSSSRNKSSLAGAALAGVAGAAIASSIISDRRDDHRDEDKYIKDRDEERRRDDERREKRRERRNDETEEERERRRERRRNETDEERDKRRERRREERRAADNDRREDQPEKHRDDERSDDRHDRRREEKYSERYADRHDDRETKGSDVTVTSIDPFQFQVADDAFKTPDGTRNIETFTGIQRARSPAIITVERIPHFAREASSSIRESAPEPVEDRQKGKNRETRERGRIEREAESTYEEIEHFTAPIEAAAVGAAVAAVTAEEKRRFKKRNRDDSRGRDSSPREEPDAIQAEADRIYREAILARKIAGSQNDDPIPRVVTPPEMSHKKKVSIYDAPNADFQLDRVMDPVEFKTSPTKGPSVYPSDRNFEEVMSELKRPLMTLVRPTPTPEKQVAKSSQNDPSRDGDSAESKTKEKKEKSQRDEPTSAPEPKTETVETPTSVNGTKGVTWGQNDTRHYEVESPQEIRDDPIANSMKTSESQEKPKMSAAKKASAWGALRGAFMSGAAAEAVIKATEASETEKTAKPGSPKDRPSEPFEYRGVVVEPDSSDHEAQDRGPPPVGPKPPSPQAVKAQVSHMPGAFDDDLDFTATLAAGLEDSGFDPNIVIKDPTYRRRSSPPGSNDTPLKDYRQPYAETVSDLSQVPKEGPQTETTRDVQRKDVDFEKLDKNEQMKRDKAAKRQSSESRDREPLEEAPVSSQIVEEPESYVDDTRSSKKDKKEKKSKKSKDDSPSYDDESNSRSERGSAKVSVPVDAFDDLRSEATTAEVQEDEWATPKKSKKKSKRDSDRFDSPARSMSASEVNSSVEQSSGKKSKEKSKRGSEHFDSPSRSMSASEVTSEKSSSKKSKDKSSRRSAQYDAEPVPEEIPLPNPTASEVSKDDDYESRKTKKSSKRHSASYSDDADTRSVKSSSSKHGDDDESKSSKKDKKSGGFFGLFGSSNSKSEPDKERERDRDRVRDRDRAQSKDTDDIEEPKKKEKKSKRRSMGDSSEIYGDDTKTTSNENSHETYSDDDGEIKRSTNGDDRHGKATEKEESFLDNAGTLGAGVGIVAAAALAVQHLQSQAAQDEREDPIADLSASDYEAKPEPPIVDSSQDPIEEDILDPEITERQFRPSIDPQYGDLLPLPPSDPGSPHVEPLVELPALPESRPGTPPKSEGVTPRERSRKTDHATPVKTPSRSAVPLASIFRHRTTPSSPHHVRTPSIPDSTFQSPDSLITPKARSRPVSWDKEDTKGMRPLRLLDPDRFGASSYSPDSDRQHSAVEESVASHQPASVASSHEVLEQQSTTDNRESVLGPISRGSEAPLEDDPFHQKSSDTKAPDAPHLGPLPESGPSTLSKEEVNLVPLSIGPAIEDKTLAAAEIAGFSGKPISEPLVVEKDSNISGPSPLPEVKRSTTAPEKTQDFQTDATTLVTTTGLGLAAVALAATLSHDEKDDVPEITPKLVTGKELPIEYQVEPITKDRSSYQFQATPPAKRHGDNDTVSPVVTPQPEAEISSPTATRAKLAEVSIEGQHDSPARDVAREREATLESLTGPQTRQTEVAQVATPTQSAKDLKQEVDRADEFSFTPSKKSMKDKKKSASQFSFEDELSSTTISSPSVADTLEEIAPMEEFSLKKSKKDKKKDKKRGLNRPPADEQPSAAIVPTPSIEAAAQKPEILDDGSEARRVSLDKPAVEESDEASDAVQAFSMKISRKDKAVEWFDTDDQSQPAAELPADEADTKDESSKPIEEPTLSVAGSQAESAARGLVEEILSKKSKKNKKGKKRNEWFDAEEVPSPMEVLPTLITAAAQGSDDAEDVAAPEAALPEPVEAVSRDADVFEGFTSKKPGKEKKKGKKNDAKWFDAEDTPTPTENLLPPVVAATQEAGLIDDFSFAGSKKDKKKDKKNAKTVSRSSTMDSSVVPRPSASLDASNEDLSKATKTPLPPALEAVDFDTKIADDLSMHAEVPSKIESPDAKTTDELSKAIEVPLPVTKEYDNLDPQATEIPTENAKKLGKPDKRFAGELKSATKTPLPATLDVGDLDAEETDEVSQPSRIPLPPISDTEDLNTSISNDLSEVLPENLPTVPNADISNQKTASALHNAATIPLPMPSETEDLELENKELSADKRNRQESVEPIVEPFSFKESKKSKKKARKSSQAWAHDESSTLDTVVAKSRSEEPAEFEFLSAKDSKKGKKKGKPLEAWEPEEPVMPESAWEQAQDSTTKVPTERDIPVEEASGVKDARPTGIDSAALLTETASETVSVKSSKKNMKKGKSSSYCDENDVASSSPSINAASAPTTEAPSERDDLSGFSTPTSKGKGKKKQKRKSIAWDALEAEEDSSLASSQSKADPELVRDGFGEVSQTREDTTELHQDEAEESNTIPKGGNVKDLVKALEKHEAINVDVHIPPVEVEKSTPLPDSNRMPNTPSDSDEFATAATDFSGTDYFPSSSSLHTPRAQEQEDQPNRKGYFPSAVRLLPAIVTSAALAAKSRAYEPDATSATNDSNKNMSVTATGAQGSSSQAQEEVLQAAQTPLPATTGYNEEQLEAARQMSADFALGRKKSKNKKGRPDVSRTATQDDDFPTEAPDELQDLETTPINVKLKPEIEIASEPQAADGLAAGYKEEQLLLAKQLQEEFGAGAKKSKKGKKARGDLSRTSTQDDYSSRQTPDEQNDPQTPTREIDPKPDVDDGTDLQRADGLAAGYKAEQILLAKQLQEEFGAGEKKSKKGKKSRSTSRTPHQESEYSSAYLEESRVDQPGEEETSRDIIPADEDTRATQVPDGFKAGFTPDQLELARQMREEFSSGSKKSKKDKKRQSLIRSATDDGFEDTSLPTTEVDSATDPVHPLANEASVDDFGSFTSRKGKKGNKKRQSLLRSSTHDSEGSVDPTRDNSVEPGRKQPETSTRAIETADFPSTLVAELEDLPPSSLTEEFESYVFTTKKGKKDKKKRQSLIQSSTRDDVPPSTSTSDSKELEMANDEATEKKGLPVFDDIANLEGTSPSKLTEEPEAFVFTTKKGKKNKKRQSVISSPAPEEEPSAVVSSDTTEPDLVQSESAGKERSETKDVDLAELEAELNFISNKSKKKKGKKTRDESDVISRSEELQKTAEKAAGASLADRIWAGIMPSESPQEAESPQPEPEDQSDLYTTKKSKKDKKSKSKSTSTSELAAPANEKTEAPLSWADETAQADIPESKDSVLDSYQETVLPYDISVDKPGEPFEAAKSKSVTRSGEPLDDGQVVVRDQDASILKALSHEHISQEHATREADISEHPAIDCSQSEHHGIAVEDDNDHRSVAKVATVGLGIAALGTAILSTALTGKDKEEQAVTASPPATTQDDDAKASGLDKSEKNKGKGQAKIVDRRSTREEDLFDDPMLWEGAETQRFDEHENQNEADGCRDFWSAPVEEDIGEELAPVESHKRDRTASMDVWQPPSVFENLKTPRKHEDEDVPAAIARDVVLGQQHMEEEPVQFDDQTPEQQDNNGSEDFVRRPSKKGKKSRKQSQEAELDAPRQLEESAALSTSTTRDTSTSEDWDAVPSRKESKKNKKKGRLASRVEPTEPKDANKADVYVTSSKEAPVAEEQAPKDLERQEVHTSTSSTLPVATEQESTGQQGFRNPALELESESRTSEVNPRKNNRGQEIYLPLSESLGIEYNTEQRGLEVPSDDYDRGVQTDSLRKKHRSQEVYIPLPPMLPVVHEEESTDQQEKGIAEPERKARDRSVDDNYRDSAFVGESPIPFQKRFPGDHEPTRDSGVHLGDTPLSKARKFPVASTDDALARLSWPAVDEETETVDLNRSLRSKLASSPKSHPSSAVTVAAATLGVSGLASELSRPKTRHSSAEIEHIERPTSANIKRLQTPEQPKYRPASVGSNRSSNLSSTTPPLRRSDRRISGDLRSLSQRSQPNLAKQSKEAEEAQQRSPATSIVNVNPIANEGRVRSKDMADVYDGFGEGRIGSPMSPTRPHSMRRRQSMQVLDLEARLEQLAAENRMLAEAKEHAEHSLHAAQKATLALAERDAELDSLKQTLEWLHKEVERLKEVNDGLTSANITLGNQHDERYGSLESRHAQATRDLEEVRQAHTSLSAGLDGIVLNQVLAATQERDREIAQLRQDLEAAQERIREMQREILASKPVDSEFLVFRDEDYFDNACQQLCQHVQQWVLRFSKFSDMRACRLTSEINNDKIIDRLDNAVLDGSDVDEYLSDRVKRRDIFMSMTMTMIWEFVFTRYLFGMDREQRQKLKTLEKTLAEVGPPSAVHHWRATTLTLLSKRNAFQEQREQDTEAVVQVIFQTLSEILPPPTQLEVQIQEQLKRVMRAAIDLSIEMRTQRAEYMMLPPLRPEYDANGELAGKVHFNAALMNERSGDTVSNEELEASMAVVKIVLFPLVVKKGDDSGEGDDEIVVCPAQVLVAKPKKHARVSQVENANHSRMSLSSNMPTERVPDI